MILPTLLDVIESCVVSQGIMDEMTSAFHRMIRAALRITPYTQRKYKLSSEALLKRLDMAPLHHYIDMKVLGYAGHIERMCNMRMPKKIRDGVLPGPKKKGGQYKTHHTFLRQCLKRKGFTDDDWKKVAKNKSKWAKKIRLLTNKNARITNCKAKTKPFEPWEAAPSSIMGRHVEKKFGAKWFGGIVISSDIDADTNDTIWRVRYDDGDMEDCDTRELSSIICQDFDALT